MATVSEKSFVSAMIGNRSFGSVLKKSLEIRDAEGIIFILFVSRCL